MGNIRPLSQRNSHGDIKGLTLNQRLLLEQGQSLNAAGSQSCIQAPRGPIPSDLRCMGSENW